MKLVQVGIFLGQYQETVQKFIQHAINDYAVQIDKFKHPAILMGISPAYAQAHEEWPDKPILPVFPHLN
jgi:hypothetical protein